MHMKQSNCSCFPGCEKVTEIQIVNGGSGYTSAPTVIITLGDTTGYGAVAIAEISEGIVTKLT